MSEALQINKGDTVLVACPVALPAAYSSGWPP